MSDPVEIPKDRFSQDMAQILIPKFLAFCCSCIAWFVSDLVEIPKDRFSQDMAQIAIKTLLQVKYYGKN